MIDLKKGIEIGEACDKCGSADAQAGRQVRPLHRLQRLSGVHEHARARNERARIGDRRGRDRAVRELRQADGDEARTLRPVPRLHRLPRVQDDAQADRHQAGRAARGQGGSDPRREVPALHVQPRRQAGPLRRVHGVHEATPSASTSSTRRPASSARRTPTRAARSSSGSRSAGRRSSAARTIPTATSSSGTARSTSRARSAARRISSRRPPRSSDARSSATTRSATTRAPKRCPRRLKPPRKKDATARRNATTKTAEHAEKRSGLCEFCVTSCLRGCRF